MTISTESRPRPRWRMTLDELCTRCNCYPNDLERLAHLGAFGDRWREPRDRGKWRHISREVAQRAVLCSRLISAGLTEESASQVSRLHTLRTTSPLIVETPRGITLTINRDDLP